MDDPADYLRKAIREEEIPIDAVKEVLVEMGYSVSINIFREMKCPRQKENCFGPGEVPLQGTGRVW